MILYRSLFIYWFFSFLFFSTVGSILFCRYKEWIIAFFFFLSHSNVVIWLQVHPHPDGVLVLSGWCHHCLLLTGTWVSAPKYPRQRKTQKQSKSIAYVSTCWSLYESLQGLQSHFMKQVVLCLWFLHTAAGAGAVSSGPQLCCMWEGEVQTSQVSSKCLEVLKHSVWAGEMEGTDASVVVLNF